MILYEQLGGIYSPVHVSKTLLSDLRCLLCALHRQLWRPSIRSLVGLYRRLNFEKACVARLECAKSEIPTRARRRLLCIVTRTHANQSSSIPLFPLVQSFLSRHPSPSGKHPRLGPLHTWATRQPPKFYCNRAVAPFSRWKQSWRATLTRTHQHIGNQASSLRHHVFSTSFKLGKFCVNRAAGHTGGDAGSQHSVHRSKQPGKSFCQYVASKLPTDLGSLANCQLSAFGVRATDRASIVRRPDLPIKDHLRSRTGAQRAKDIVARHTPHGALGLCIGSSCHSNTAQLGTIRPGPPT